MVTVFFTSEPDVTDFHQAKTSDVKQFRAWFHAMLERGIYWPPSQFEAAFLSAAMTDEDIAHLLKSARAAFVAARLAMAD